MTNFALMNLVYLVETVIQKHLIIPCVGKLSKVASSCLYVREYDSSKLGGGTLCQSEKFCNTPFQLNVFQLDSFCCFRYRRVCQRNTRLQW